MKKQRNSDARRVVILDADSLGRDLEISRFGELGELTVYRTTTPENAAEHLAGAEIAILNKVRLTGTILAAAPDLCLILEAATGYDNIDLVYCREHGIAVCNVIGYSTQCVAQLTATLALALTTHLREYSDYVADGSYTASGQPNLLEPVYHELFGKTWGIVGYGNIGRQVGRIAQAFGCRVLVNKRTPTADAECVSLECLCRESDIISIHTPLNDTTRNLIDRDRIGMMKRGAILINVARGAVTDEAALADAITEGRLGGLGVDVYAQEPFPKDHPYQKIRTYPNVLFTPHIAWGGYETRVRLMEEMLENARAFDAGKIRNRVDLL